MGEQSAVDEVAERAGGRSLRHEIALLIAASGVVLGALTAVAYWGLPAFGLLVGGVVFAVLGLVALLFVSRTWWGRILAAVGVVVVPVLAWAAGFMWVFGGEGQIGASQAQVDTYNLSILGPVAVGSIAIGAFCLVTVIAERKRARLRSA